MSVTVMQWLFASQSNIKVQNLMLSVLLIVMISHMPESSIFIQFTQKGVVSYKTWPTILLQKKHFLLPKW
jgi:hypothetical protein